MAISRSDIAICISEFVKYVREDTHLSADDAKELFYDIDSLSIILSSHLEMRYEDAKEIIRGVDYNRYVTNGASSTEHEICIYGIRDGKVLNKNWQITFDKHPIVVMLRGNGHDPCFYKRGDLYRAHVDRFGNSWAEAETPIKAIELTYESWKKFLE